MTSSHCDEERFCSIAFLSPPLWLKSAILELPNPSDPIILEISPTPESTLPEILSYYPTQTSAVHTQSISSTVKTRHSPTAPPTIL